MVATASCEICGAGIFAGAPDGHCTKCLFLLGLNPGPDPAWVGEPDLGPLLAKRHTASGVKFHRLGNYELIEEIGRGGMGVVFRARQVDLNRTVAVKLMLGGTLASPSSLRRFQVEAEAAAGLQHPHIVSVFETGESDGHPFYSMEWIDGTRLDERIAGCSPEASREAARARQTWIAQCMA